MARPSPLRPAHMRDLARMARPSPLRPAHMRDLARMARPSPLRPAHMRDLARMARPSPLRPRHMRETLPEFDVEVQRARRRPHTITFTPRRLTADMELFRDIPRVIRREVNDLIRAFDHGAVNGVLYATNLDNPTSSRYRAFHGLNEINAQLIADLIEEFGNSDTPVEIERIEWMVMLDPGIYAHGAGISIPSYLAKRKIGQLGWTNHSDSQGPITCAAVAIVLAIQRIEYSKNEKNKRQLLIDARKLQTELGWGDTVTIPQISDFVALYKQYRLTVLNSVATSFRHHTFTGSEFVNDIDRDTSKITSPFVLYILFDPMQQHYAECRAPGALFQRIHNDVHQRFCHGCVMVYRDNHTCDDGKIVKKTKAKTIWCEECDSHVHPKHHHNMKQCRTCEGLYDIQAGYNNHRCIIIEEEKEDPGISVLKKVITKAELSRKVFQQNGITILKLSLIQLKQANSKLKDFS